MTKADNTPQESGGSASDSSASRSSHNAAGPSLPRRCLLLLLVLLLCELVLGGIAFSVDGTLGVEASLVALLTSVVGGWLALLVVDFFGWLLVDEVVALAHAVFGMLVRAGVSLAVCGAAYLFETQPSQYGLVFYLLAFYMITLSVETIFAVQHFSQAEFS